MKEVFNIFNNIADLELENAEFEENQLNYNIHLPKLKSINVKKFRYIKLFSQLNLLKYIWIKVLDDIITTEINFDPINII